MLFRSSPALPGIRSPATSSPSPMRTGRSTWCTIQLRVEDHQFIENIPFFRDTHLAEGSSGAVFTRECNVLHRKLELHTCPDLDSNRLSYPSYFMKRQNCRYIRGFIREGNVDTGLPIYSIPKNGRQKPDRESSTGCTASAPVYCGKNFYFSIRP